MSTSSQTTIRPVKAEDIEPLLVWLEAPHVKPWWGTEAPKASRLKYQSRLRSDALTRVFIIQVDHKPAGMIQCYLHSDYPDCDREIGIANAIGIDYLIGAPDLTGKGIGTQAIKLMTRMALTLFSQSNAVVASPHKENIASCRALEKAGFALVREAKLASAYPSEGISCIYQKCRS
ncbi:MAG: GNAT family N-acetyltransferase [Candidatus Melainabacteria bacterium]|nr:GNAT family N-acetyltransferase [Candidatus Melainabacteria bacterium]